MSRQDGADAHEVEGRYPLSPVQDGFLLDSLSAPTAGAGIWQMILDLREQVDEDALEDALGQVIRRHATLRSRFLRAGEHVQEVIASPSVPVFHHDWTDLEEGPREERFAEWLVEDRRQGIDFSQAPLLRWNAFRFADEHRRYVVTVHHAVVDGRSAAFLLRELFTLYEAGRRGESVELPPAVPFRHYVDWLGRQGFEGTEEFWRRALAGVDEATPLTIGRSAAPSEAADTNPLAETECRFDAAHTAALFRLAEEHQVTLNTLLQGAWALLLSRYSQRHRVVFGVVRALRAAVEGGDRIVGPMINALPFRVDVDERQGLVPWLQGLRRHWLEMRGHEHVSAERLHEWSAVPASEPLYESAVVFEKFELTEMLRRLGKSWERRDFRFVRQSSVAFGIYGFQSREFKVCLIYDRQRCEPAAARRVLGHLRNLLESMPAKAHEPCGALGMLDTAERHQLLCEWNDSGTAPAEHGVHALVLAQARRRPDALAVSWEDGSDQYEALSFGELDRRSERLARRLRALGVGPEVRVALSLPRSCDLVVSALAVLRAAGAYLPVDPETPSERLAFILGDARARLLVTRGSLEVASRPELLDLDTFDPAEDDTALRELEAAPAGRHLAYVIYTSGSTGRPKGVAVAHESLYNLVAWHRSRYRPGPGRRATLVASPGFDASVWETWPYLAAGASLHVPPQQVVPEPPRLLEWLASRRITHSFIPTPLTEHLLAEPWPEHSALEVLLTGGDTLHQGPPQALRGPLLVNHYGPTENTVVATCTEVASGPGRPLIGRPIDGVRVFLLDRDLRPAPLGSRGEIFLGGRSLARGYLGRPGQTAERFVPRPRSERPGERLYRTGDRGCFAEDGRIDFLGRSDRQVQIRGLRTEPGEIEAVLAGLPAVRKAAVVFDQEHLTAFLVAVPGEDAGEESLRRQLEDKLPAHMIPTRWHHLDRLPLTVNGKVDRKRLSELAAEAGPRQAAAPPQSPVEEALVEAWKEVLGSGEIDPNSHFFSLGGHSVTAVRVMARLEDLFGVKLPLNLLLETPVLRELARRIEDEVRRQAPERPSPPRAASARPPELPLSPAQQRLWFLHQLEPQSPRYNVSRAYALDGPLDVRALASAFAAVLARHEILRTRFPRRDATAVQVIAPARDPGTRLHLTDLGSLPAERREAVAESLLREAARLPFPLARGPVARLAVLRLAERRHRLFLGFHHIVADAGSMEVFFRELGTLYRRFRTSRSRQLADPLPALPIQYADYALAERERQEEPALAEDLAWWRERLAGVPPLGLATDRPRSAGTREHGGRRATRIPAELGSAVDELGRRHDATLMMTLLAVYAVLLGRHAAQDDLTVGIPASRRDRAELEGLIGFFVNTLVLRCDLGGQPSFLELLARVRETALEAYSRSDVAFDQLVEAVRPERSMRRNPLFQVMLVFEPRPWQLPVLSGLRVRALPLSSGLSHFDMLLYAVADGGRLDLVFDYDADLFHATTIERFLGHLRAILAAVAAAPELRVGDLDLLSPGERHQVLAEWSTDGASRSGEAGVPELWRRQVRSVPDRLAVAWAGGARADVALSYGELGRRAACLARHLAASGVGPETRVGLCLPRGGDLVAAALAVLEAGGAYLPLDPAAPDERLGFLLADARARLVVTTGALGERLAPVLGPGCRQLRVDPWPEEIPAGSAAPARPVHPENLAYVIYTSGSTGRPKGVEVDHRALANLVAWHRLPSGARATLVAGVGFDVSVLEIWPALAAGASLDVPSEVLLPDPAGLLGWLARARITHTFLPTPLAELVLQQEWPAHMALEAVYTAGEKLHRGAPAGLAARLFNLYGPTEGTVISTGCAVGGEPPTIGRPIDGVSAHVADDGLGVVALGGVGELLLGGRGLARGYLGRPAASAAAFVPHPWSGTPGRRLYKTGDLARFTSEGRIDFLGRRDHQVKIRGVRIEPGEVEETLKRHPRVREAAVVVAEDEEVPRLVGFVVGTEENAQSLRSFLHRELPAAMVPATIVFSENLPRSPSGKVDRRLLSRRAAACRVRPAGAVLPSTAVEKGLAAVWEEVLGVEGVGLDDNFFDLGGHSLVLVRVQDLLAERLGRSVPLVDFFEHPTLRSLAHRLGESAPETSPPGDASPDDEIVERARRQRAARHRRRRPGAGR